MNTTSKILLSVLLASTAGFGVACSQAKTSEEAVSGEDAVTEGSSAGIDADAIERRMTCIHHRRERTKVNGKRLTRAFHLKSHGCVKGTMTIDPKLDADKRIGVFAATQPWSVWMRLSNINQPADNVLDLRGLALKLVNVPGKKQIGGDPLNGQDFLMNDTKVHFLNRPEDVIRASELADGSPADPAKDREVGIALQTRGVKQLSKPNTLFFNEYHSRAPFKLGEEWVIRYFVETCSTTENKQFNGESSEAAQDKDHLTRDFHARAKSPEGICLLFKAQFRPTKGSESWLDDYITEWKDSEVTLAKIEFPSQDVEANEGVCENLTFSPLNSLKEHEGVGVMNKGRYYIYKASRAAGSKREDLSKYKCDEIFPDFDTRRGPAASP